MSGSNTVGMSAVSTEELEQVEGGVAFLLGGLFGIGVTVGATLVTKHLMQEKLGSGAAGIAKAAGLTQE